MLNQQTPILPQQQSAKMPESSIVPVSQPDSTSYYYFARLDTPSDLAWLSELLHNKELTVNQIQLPIPVSFIQRRNELMGIKTAPLTNTDTPSATTLDTVKATKPITPVAHTTPVVVADTVVIPVKPDTTTQQITIDTTSNLAKADTLAPVATTDSLYINTDSLTTSADSIAPAEITLQPQKKLFEEISKQETRISNSLDAFLSKTDWMVVVLLLSVLVATWAKTAFSKFFGQMFRSLIFYSESYKVYRENNMMARRFYLMLGFVFNINLALFLFMVIEYSGWYIFDIGHMLYLPILFGVVTLAYFIKNIALRTIGQLFMAYRIAEEYWFSLSTINRALGLILFPFLLAIPFVPDYYRSYVIGASWGLLAIAFVFRIFRGIRIAHEKQLSIFYMILYFCTLEILPIAILYKVISEAVSGL